MADPNAIKDELRSGLGLAAQSIDAQAGLTPRAY
jgi:hypothetical protein